MTEQELQAQRAALVAARASGALRVSFMSAGVRREVEYRSISEIQLAINAIDRDLAANNRVRVFYPYFEKGL